MLNCFTRESTQSIPIYYLLPAEWGSWLCQQTQFVQQWVETTRFQPLPGHHLLFPDQNARLSHVVLFSQEECDFWTFGLLSGVLPEGNYYPVGIKNERTLYHLALAWGLGAYEFTRYKSHKKSFPKLVCQNFFEKKFSDLEVQLRAMYYVRDLINTSAADMNPTTLAEAVSQLGIKYRASVTQTVGEDLLDTNYPAIYAVGKGSRQEPRICDLRWGNPSHPKISIVGKGVCFDSGGYHLKTCSNLGLMKKDMGGAANAIGLAEMIMAYELPVCLRLLIPAVENLISGNAYKPGDIISTRSGLTIEVGNTDAEGRLILADALYEADRENPQLLIDLSTLTGAARTALGTEISAFFTRQDFLAEELMKHSQKEQDPIWRLPLYKPYQKLIESPWAHLNNCGASPFAGAITAALFLSHFVRQETAWVHFDFNAYNVSTRPGRPEGGEAMAISTLLSYLREKWIVSAKNK